MATMLELVATRPDWAAALEVALLRPPGVPERRAQEDPWTAVQDEDRPRRISDDLAWLRYAIEEPDGRGLTALEDTAAVGAWEPEDDPEVLDRLRRLEQRGVLEAAGFLMHTPPE